jgi:hypothetical protein
LREAILAKFTATVDGGWLYKHFNDKSTSKKEAFIYLRGAISQQCMENSESTRTLTMVVLDEDTHPIDKPFLMSILTTYITSEKSQKVEENMFEWLLCAGKSGERTSQASRCETK